MLHRLCNIRRGNVDAWCRAEYKTGYEFEYKRNSLSYVAGCLIGSGATNKPTNAPPRQQRYQGALACCRVPRLLLALSHTLESRDLFVALVISVLGTAHSHGVHRDFPPGRGVLLSILNWLVIGSALCTESFRSS